MHRQHHGHRRLLLLPMIHRRPRGRRAADARRRGRGGRRRGLWGLLGRMLLLLLLGRAEDGRVERADPVGEPVDVVAVVFWGDRLRVVGVMYM